METTIVTHTSILGQSSINAQNSVHMLCVLTCTHCWKLMNSVGKFSRGFSLSCIFLLIATALVRTSHYVHTSSLCGLLERELLLYFTEFLFLLSFSLLFSFQPLSLSGFLVLFVLSFLYCLYRFEPEYQVMTVQIYKLIRIVCTTS
jgi:hypothetical protein